MAKSPCPNCKSTEYTTLRCEINEKGGGFQYTCSECDLKVGRPSEFDNTAAGQKVRANATKNLDGSKYEYSPPKDAGSVGAIVEKLK